MEENNLVPETVLLPISQELIDIYRCVNKRTKKKIQALLKPRTLYIASIATVMIKSVTTITIEKFRNVKLKVYISKMIFKTQHTFPHNICLLKKLLTNYVRSIWYMDERFFISKAIKSWGFFNSRSLARCKIRPNNNTIEEGLFFLLSYLFTFSLLITISPYFTS